jgi:F0F1-type ATP synthase membrane subunit c/vacuolar-type H+-ATPase subunit K
MKISKEKNLGNVTKKIAATIALVVLFTSSNAFADQAFYVIDKSVRPGMLMSTTADPNVVEPATAANAASLVGVLNDENTTFDVQPGQMTVVTGGVRDALVTTIDGDIKSGDPISASSIVGFGSKLEGAGWIVGVAQGDMNSGTEGAIKSTVADSSGKQHEAYAGSVPVLIKVTYFDPAAADRKRDFVPIKIQEAVESITGRHASQLAILLAFLILLAGFFVAGLIINSAIRSAIQATARQPLAKQAILRRMVQSCGLGVGLLIVAVFGALGILRIL